MKKTITPIIIMLLFGMTASFAQAQDLDKEAGFIYLKAKYLNETDRHEEAIREFNKVVKMVADFEDALVLRADSKLALAAYKGAELDALEAIRLKGITPDVSLVLAKAQYELDNITAAQNSFVVAVQLNPQDPEPLDYLGKIAKADNDIDAACEYWTSAAALGSAKAREMAARYCKGTTVTTKPPARTDREVISVGTRPKTETTDAATEEEPTRTSTAETEAEDRSKVADEINGKINTKAQDNSKPRKLEIKDVKITDTDTATESNDPPVAVSDPDLNAAKQKPAIETADIEAPKEDPVIVDDTPQYIDVDDDLKLTIYGQALGKRDIMKTPNILILSENDGIVAIDICVNEKGKVVDANFNSDLSTLGKKSLISLAIRKSKEFVFESNDYDQQCGVILFDIKGS